MPSFNPRVLAGGRDFQLSPKAFHIPVSIHASSREDATPLIELTILAAVFQSTRPRGRTRLRITSDHRLPIGFNPRVLAGGRDLMLKVPWNTIVFQSTRPRGRTRPLRIERNISPNRFNPRVLAGGRDSMVA